MNFVTNLLVLTNYKGDNYNSILIIVNKFIKIVYYKLVLNIINIISFAIIIINMIIRYYSLPNSIVSDKKLISIFIL